MRILVLIGPNPNQQALASKIQRLYPDVHIIIEKRLSAKKRTLKQLASKAVEKLTLGFIDEAWNKLMQHYSQEKYKIVKDYVHYTANLNSDEAYELAKSIDPDLVIVSGTSLLRQKILSLKPAKGILNLHTGLSPYIKGGPNCTNWCIATGQWNLIGNTIMWIDAGIDTGNIITTERVALQGNESFYDIHLKVMEGAHDLYLRAIAKIVRGEAVPNVSQDSIAKGTTYYNRQWNLKMKMKLKENMKKRQGVQVNDGVRLVDLNKEA
ncbi:MAG: formyltransferase family protein [Bacteroidota bacterium]